MKKLLIIFFCIGFLPLFVAAQRSAKLSLNYNFATSLKYSPDRTMMAVAEGNELYFYTAGTTTLIRKLKIKGSISSFDFSQDGKYLVIATGKKVLLYHTTSEAPEKEWVNKTELVNILCIDQQKVAVITEKALEVYDFESQQVVFSNSSHIKPIRCVSVSRDAKYALTGGGDGKVILYNIHDGSVILNKKTNENWIRAVDISPDNQIIASGDDDGKVILSDAEGNKLTEFTDPRGWVMSVKFSGDGKYLAVGDEKGNCLIYSIERKILSLKLPDQSGPVTALAFSYDGKELATIAALKGIKAWDVSALNISAIYKIRDAKDHTPPQILVSNPPNMQNDRYRFSKDFIDIKGTVVDESGVRVLKINGVETPVKDNGNFILYLPLTMGDNFVTLEARDINDNTAVKKFIITRKDLDGEEYDVSKAKNYLFVVGINDYEHWPKLNNAVKDASDVSSTLLGMYNFDFTNVILLKNEQATRNNIYKSLRGLISQITPQDNLLIYYSGHGYYDELLNEGYWIPVDAKVNASGDYLSNSDLLKVIGSISSQHTFLVADACFSGSLFSDSKRGYTENVEKFKSRWGLASGRLEVVSDGTVGENSPFTTTFLEFLKENQKEKFPVSELIQYVKVKVAEKSDQTPLGNPLKGAGDEGGEFVFYKKK